MGQNPQRKNTVWTTLLCPIITPLLAGITALVGYRTQLLSTWEWNIAFLLLFLVSAFVMLSAQGNAKRCLYATSMLAVLLTAYVYNCAGGYVLSPVIDFREFLSSFCGLWTALGVPTLIYAIVLCVRLLLWSQQDWEELRSDRRKRCREYLQRRRTWWADLKKISMDNRSKQKDFWQSEKEKSRKAKAERRELKREARKKRLQDAIAQGKKFPAWLGRLPRYLFGLVVFASLVTVFLALPGYTSAEENIVAGWLASLQSFMGVVSDGDMTYSSALAGYTLLFIAILSVGYFAVQVILRFSRTVWEKLTNPQHTSGSFLEFFNEYSTPISVLIVAISILTAFSGNGFSIEDLPQFFGNLIIIVLAIMLFLVAVDAIRLVLTQCTTPGSLLRTSTHLFFTLLIESMMGIAIGVLMEIDIRSTISSLFILFIPGNRTLTYQEVDDTLDEALHWEIREIRGSMCEKQKSAFNRFHRRY